MSKILDQSVPEWRVLVDIIPLFSLNLENSWKLLHREGSDPDVDKASVAQFKTHITSFRIHMRSLTKRRPKAALPISKFNLCKDDLSDLLDFLESEIVLDEPGSGKEPLERTYPTVSKVPKKEAPEGYNEGNLAISETVQDWAMNSTQEYAHTTWRPPPPMKSYKKLTSLGTLIKQLKSEQNEDLLRICQASIKWYQTLQTFKDLADLAKHLMKTLECIDPSGKGDRESMESKCNWDDDSPLEVSSRLYRLLWERTCHQPHEVRLQLDGFRLSRRNTAGPRRFFLFISCSQAPNKWCEGRYKTTERGENDYDRIHDLCRHIYDFPRETHKVFFTTYLVALGARNKRDDGGPRADVLGLGNPRLLYPPNEPSARPIFPDAFPTITLAQLLERGVLIDTVRGGRFTMGDKAVLNFSLGLCLLHLFRGSWIQPRWSAADIYFLYEPYRSSEKGGKIFNIHYPYLSTSLKTPAALSNQSAMRAECRTFLLSFATVMIEIETGRRLVLPSDQELPNWIRTEAEKLRTKNKNGYLAVGGCIDIAKLLSSDTGLLDEASEPRIENIRNEMFVKVLQPLEASCDDFIGVARKPKYGPIEVPGPTSQESVSTAKAQVQSVNRPPQKGVMLSFVDDVSPPSDSSTRLYANTFYQEFLNFRRHFVIPKMANRRAGRARVKIALLDTGYFEDDHSLSQQLSDVERYRKTQGFRGLDELNPIKGRWCPQGETIEDADGHGTRLLYLLLKYAPDADSYVAKVSNTVKFREIDPVVDAIKWATDMDVDIISMSFGSTSQLLAVDDALEIAHRGRRRLIFASASNKGLNDKRTYPARDHRVFCVHALDGTGRKGPTNRTRRGEYNYGTLGRGIKLSFKGEAECKSGASYATPILAAFTANLIDWLGYHAAANSKELSQVQYDFIKSTDGMREIFQLFDPIPEEKNILYIAPWNIFPCENLSWTDEDEANGMDEEKRETIEERDRSLLGRIRLALPPLVV